MAETQEKEFVEKWKLADMEKDFLSACLLDTDQSRRLWVDLYEHIDVSYFQDKVLADVFKIYKVHFNRYKAMPSENRTADLMKDLKHPEEHINIARSVYQKDNFRAAEIQAIEDDIKLFIKNNKIKNAVLRSITLLKNEQYSEIETSIRDAIAWNAAVDLGIEMGVDGVRERYKRIQEHYSSFVLSPWSRLNEVLGGGFFNKQLSMVASSSSVGKSIFLDNVAAHAWLHQNKTVVLYSMEMSDLVKSLRIDAALTRMEMKDLRHHEDQVFDFYEKQVGPKGNKLIIKEYPTSSASPQDLIQNLYQLELYKGIKDVGLICTDYSDIMRPNKDYKGNKYMEDKDINEGLRAMAQTLNVPVVTATQFGRSATSCPLEELTEEKLSDSFWKMRSADVLVALWNTPEKREAGEIWMKTIKNRGGKKDVAWQNCVDYATLRIFEQD